MASLSSQAKWKAEDLSSRPGMEGRWSPETPTSLFFFKLSSQLKEGDLLSKISRAEARGVPQVVECLPNKYESPSSNPATAKKKKKKFLRACLDANTSEDLGTQNTIQKSVARWYTEYFIRNTSEGPQNQFLSPSPLLPLSQS
jgi:hypothetical protein